MAAKLPEKLLSGRHCETSIEHLLTSPIEPANGERTLMCWVLPPWQRPEVWSVLQKQRFIEGIFLLQATGSYVVHEPDWDANGIRPMSGWLLDGQQRISAIRDFIAGDLVVFGDIRYQDLSPGDRRRRFLSVKFPFVEIPRQEDEAVLKDIYVRMNFGGMPHTQADRDRLGAEAPEPSIVRPRPS